MSRMKAERPGIYNSLHQTSCRVRKLVVCILIAHISYIPSESVTPQGLQDVVKRGLLQEGQLNEL